MIFKNPKRKQTNSKTHKIIKILKKSILKTAEPLILACYSMVRYFR